MSANNQVIVAPYPGDLTKYAVWLDGCVDNPFDFSEEPFGVFDDLEAAMTKAHEIEGPDEMGFCVEYGIHFLPRSAVVGYSIKVWDEFPDHTYLGPDGPKGEHDPHTEFGDDVYKDRAKS